MTLDQALQTAIAHHQAGRLADAEQIYRQILAAQPKNTDALHLLGVLAGQVGQYRVAIDLINNAIALKPDHFEALSNLGNFLVAAGKPLDAVAACSRAIQINPGFADAYNNLGNALVELKRFDEAVVACNRAIQLNPRCAGAYNNLGNALRDLGRADESVAAFDRALALHPNSAETLSNRGLALAKLGRREEAVAEYHRALSLDPKLAIAHNNLAQELNAMHRYEEALTEYRTAIALDPGKPLFHWNLSLALLTMAHFAEGWKEFELGNSGIWSDTRQFSCPQWNGQALQGKAILLHQDDGGYGDFIHFVRYVQFLKDSGSRIILECKSALLPLIANMPGTDAVIPLGQPPGSLDYHVALRSLPRIFKTDLTNIPRDVPYLKAPDKYLERWRPRITGDGFKVGLVWSGASQSRLPERQRIRSDDLFAALSEFRQVRFFSLQKDAAAPPPPNFQMIDFSGELQDFADTAAVIECLDLVISVDTSVAHLVGALARPVWLLLAQNADFRWMRDRTDSPWYPTMRIFRQRSPQDFSGPITGVTTALKEISQ